jgi:flagellar basal body-associated protein FliL
MQTSGSKTNQSTKISWLLILFLVVLILIKGAFAFFWVGNRGQPTWDYRPVPDVPGESPYAIYHLLPNPQHVRGATGE